MNAVLDAVDFGLLLISTDGRIHKANRWILERSRVSGDLQGEPLATAFKAPVDPHLARAVRACLDLGNSIRLSQAAPKKRAINACGRRSMSPWCALNRMAVSSA